MQKSNTIYRKDYTPSQYLIDSTELDFQLSATETIVSAKISFYKNPKSTVIKGKSRLFLNGVSLQLMQILIDGKIPDYQLKKDGLRLNDVDDAFVLTTRVKIHPEKNTQLSGLYQSHGNFCTQCEAEGFRRITYYLDRPDILSVFTVHISADYKRYPVLLSNGNLIKNAQGAVTWFDPSPKPCYLFALVAGNFAVLSDTFKTKSGREVSLKIYTESHNINKTDFAMQAIKRAFAWDEKRFNFQYDLDIYMLVAVDDFNMGAMENKGLNIFNSACVLASADTATDTDFIDIEAVIGHEYFHNWTGNRITCRDWFQLSLKEGLTVFRDQEFTSDLHSRAIKRIDDVGFLRTVQFAEDRGPMAHSVRPEHYLEINNFYTVTVYEKGAELIRMIHTFLGENGFQKGMQLYVKRHDGCAVTIDDFIAAMEDANKFDFAKFMRWYEQSGTPKIKITSSYDPKNKIYQVKMQQTSGHNYCLPIKYGLLNQAGKELQKGMLILDEKEKTFVFDNMQQSPVASWLRGFSAPVEIDFNLSLTDRILLMRCDTDAFNRWDNAQIIWLKLILNPEQIDVHIFFDALKNILIKNDDNALLAAILTLPSERFLHQQASEIDVLDIAQKRNLVIKQIAEHFAPLLLDIYQRLNQNKRYQFTQKAIDDRALKNRCLLYLGKIGNTELAYQQFKTANCMTDKLAAFTCLLDIDNPYKKRAVAQFFADYQADTQVMDKWFALQAAAKTTDVKGIKNLMQHPLFTFNTPNRLRALIGGFCQNFTQFHQQEGYQLLTETIIKLNNTNPQIGARLASTYNHWRRFTPKLKALQKQQLEAILSVDNLSNDIFEIVNAALK